MGSTDSCLVGCQQLPLHVGHRSHTYTVPVILLCDIVCWANTIQNSQFRLSQINPIYYTIDTHVNSLYIETIMKYRKLATILSGIALYIAAGAFPEIRCKNLAKFFFIRYDIQVGTLIIICRYIIPIHTSRYIFILFYCILSPRRFFLLA